MSFSKKAAEIMHTLQTDYGEFKVPASKKTIASQKPANKTSKHNCCGLEVKITPVATNKKYSRENLLLQTPIIIQRKQQVKSMSANRTFTDRRATSIKKVEPFVPIQVPTRDSNRFKLESSTMETTVRNKEIEIIIDEDKDDKECLKKLFKKIHNLTEELAESQKQRVRLQLQLDHLTRKDFSCKEHQKIINKLEGDKYKLQMQIEILKKSAKDTARMSPKEVIKQIVVQKPFEVRVEVPKYIPGPERVIQKIVEVPKYIEVEKKIPEIIIKQIKVPQIIERQVFIDKPVYQNPIIVDKPVYIDKPIYIDRQVQIQKKVQVEVPFEVQVPVYIDRPVVDDEWLRKFQQLEQQLGQMMRENQILKGQNHSLKMTMGKLQSNIDVLSDHNRQKNREVQILLSNRGDYLPPYQQNRLQRKYSALDRTTSTLSPRSHHHLRYL